MRARLQLRWNGRHLGELVFTEGPDDHHQKVDWQLGPVDEIYIPAGHPSTGNPPHPPKGSADMSFTLKDNQQVSFSVTGKDAAGNPAPLTGTPVFAVDNTSVLTLTDHGNGSGQVTATGTLGTATLTVTDSETNGKQFMGSLAIDVVAGDVTAVEIQPGTPADVPAQPTA